jgi:2-keto-4-pentenoate hydratase/2-oxohepta-3-ene-1,7-dioic acid hydratase in catechol pathway
MRLAALYEPDGVSSSLHVDVDDGYVSVDSLATVFDLPSLRGIADVGELFRRGAQARAELRRVDARGLPRTRRGAARLAPPVRRPGKIVCVGLNYLSHIEQSRLTRPDHIVLFGKFASCLVASGEAVVVPSITSQLDYEGELAVVMGSTARSVSAEAALDHVGGYTIINDISARDLQIAEPQWMRGKSLDTFAPLGPVVVDAADAPPIDMSDGDVVEVDITGIGRLRNPVVAAREQASQRIGIRPRR